MKYLVCGTDFSFGRMGRGNAKMLEELSKTYGFTLEVVEKLQKDHRDISSTYVREEIAAGNIEKGNELLGYEYFVWGEIVHGYHLGSKMGMPTINLIPPEDKLLPKNGVYVTNTPGANAGAVSELAVLLMLAVGRKLLCHTKSLAHGSWSKNTFLNSSFCLNGKTLGIIGAGNIGRQVAKKAQAFGAVTRYYDPFRLSPEMEQQWQLSFEPLEELLATSDIITLHVPLTEENHHMIGAREIAAMKDGAILINTSRGGLVDDKALAKAVRSGKLSGAGLDVVEEEPLPACHELLSDPNIIVTPHIGGGTADIGDVIIPMLTEDIKALADGRTPAHVVNKEYMVH